MAGGRKGGRAAGEPRNLTIEILKSIRDAVRSTNERLDELRDAVRSTNERLDELRTDVNARLDRHEQALIKLIDEVGSLNERFDNFLRGEHRRDHDELRTRVERLEEHAGLRG